MTKFISLPFFFSLLLGPVAIFADDPFTLSGGGCISGTSGSNCVRDWTIENGPGWTGHRADWDTVSDAWRTRILCSSSCQRHGSDSNECMLISVMHGIYSNPSDMVWLMLGSLYDDDAFSESASDSGPFCISFHKAIGDAWQYNCAAEDALHMAGFFEFILDEFPIDPNAIALHGFSSGAIMTNHLMTTGCPVEKFVSIGAPYAAGFVQTPPTTKAAYIISHGTHDNIVQYDEKWDFTTNTVSLSCECNEFPGSGTCSYSTYLTLQGERLAAAVASLRGYAGDVWTDDDPNRIIHSPIDLVNEDLNKCNENYNECINPFVSPNPWNTDFDCSTLGIDETDVIEYPVSEGGKVQMLRMNLHNHDYPNKRRVNYYGPTEFFFYLKNFFISNKGPHGPWGQRSTTVQEGRECFDPLWWTRSSPPDLIFRNDTYYIPGDLYSSIYFDKFDCEQWCLNEKRCFEAFYYEQYWGRSCQIYVDENSLCTNVGYGGSGTHIVATTAPLMPTSAPSSQAPTGEPCTPLSLCPTCGQLLNIAPAGYACLDPTGISIGDDNLGYTETDCSNNGSGYVWAPYNCYDADQALLYYDYDDELRAALRDAWQPKCCDVSLSPTMFLSSLPSLRPSHPPTDGPSTTLTQIPSNGPTLSSIPSETPTASLSGKPSSIPTNIPTALPTVNPSSIPTGIPTKYPTGKPSVIPSSTPSKSPTVNPSTIPTGSPTEYPTGKPSSIPSSTPSKSPTVKPSRIPTVPPSSQPTPYCVDSTLQVVLNGVITTCPFATPSDCERESLASTCPYTCGACREWACEDAIGTVIFPNGNYGKCDVFEDIPSTTVARICQMYQFITTTCRGTCQFCEN